MGFAQLHALSSTEAFMGPILFDSLRVWSIIEMHTLVRALVNYNIERSVVANFFSATFTIILHKHAQLLDCTLLIITRANAITLCRWTLLTPTTKVCRDGGYRRPCCVTAANVQLWKLLPLPVRRTA